MFVKRRDLMLLLHIVSMEAASKKKSSSEFHWSKLPHKGNKSTEYPTKAIRSYTTHHHQWTGTPVQNMRTNLIPDKLICKQPPQCLSNMVGSFFVQAQAHMP